MPTDPTILESFLEENSLRTDKAFSSAIKTIRRNLDYLGFPRYIQIEAGRNSVFLSEDYHTYDKNQLVNKYGL